MNFKTMLLTTAAVTMIAGVANAKDFTGSLFLPSQGELLSNTSIEHGRLKDKYTGIDKTLVAGEELTYGVTDNLSIFGAIVNAFDGGEFSNQKYFNNDHNFAYEVGAKYNHNFGRVLTQAGLSYQTFQPASWTGHKGVSSDWSKMIEAEVQVGYDMGNGWTPYAMLTADTVIDEHHRPINYSAFAGVHKTFDKFAVDTGLRYEYNHDGKIGNYFHNDSTEQYFWQLEADYFLTDNVALGIHGDYYLGGDDSDVKTKYEYTIGAQLKVLF